MTLLQITNILILKSENNFLKITFIIIQNQLHLAGLILFNTNLLLLIKEKDR